MILRQWFMKKGKPVLSILCLSSILMSTYAYSAVDANIYVSSVGDVVAGDEITINYTVMNVGDVSYIFGVGCEIRQGSFVKEDLGGQWTGTILPSNRESASFTFTIPESWSAGTYTARAAVWTGWPGSSTWLDSYDRDFTAQAQPLNLSGRLVYHSYSSYLAEPEPGDDIDGNIFLYSFETGRLRNLTSSLDVKNAMNPHFSPDGSNITFMAIPADADRSWYSLEIYVYDLATEILHRLTNNQIPDEDGKFSPDGSEILFKSNRQIHMMNTDGSSKKQLTYTSDEKSGPNFSPDGSHIVYWSGSGANSDIWSMLSGGTGAAQIIGISGLSEYYPIYLNNNNILYTRWESTLDQNDKIYKYSVSSGSIERLAINQAGVNDSDAFSISDALIGFSSTRGLQYDIYIGNLASSDVYSIPKINSNHYDLGGWYTPLAYARRLELEQPSDGQELYVEEELLLKVKAYSDGDIWTDASPSIRFEGSSTSEFTGLRDDGTAGDEIAGDGRYSKTITLPSRSGNFTVTAYAISTDNGLENHIQSESVEISLIESDGNVDLADAIFALQVVAGTQPTSPVYKTADVNGDDKIGLEEVIYILQKVSGPR